MIEIRNKSLKSSLDDKTPKQIFSKTMAYLRGFLLRRKVITSGPIKSFGGVVIRKHNGIIKIGAKSTLWPKVKLVSSSFSNGKPAILEIGSRTAVGDNTQIHCGESIKIGNDVLISWDVNILDHDYHASGGGKVIPQPVVIEDETWIGIRCLILKGVTIGKGAIIGAGSVVTRDVPPYTFAAGNPAKPIKKIPSWKGTFEGDPEKIDIKLHTS
jgi:acetyltransferase-like isoleucine patch superfamily enzyme